MNQPEMPLSSSPPTVALFACGGIGQLMSTIVRQACVRVAQRHPHVVLLSPGALLGDVEEELSRARRLPVILVDGCKEHCGTIIAEAKGLKIVARLLALALVRKDHIRLAGENRAQLGPVGLAAVEDVAAGIEAEIQRLYSLANKENPEAI